jgi:hypothetical protein
MTTQDRNHFVVAALLSLSFGCTLAEERAAEPAVSTSLLRYEGENAGSCTVTQVPSTEPTCYDHNNTMGIANPAVITRVVGSGLPTVADGGCDKELINFIYTDSEGPGGMVLGCTDTGTWTVDLCAPPPGTYSFVSRGFGKPGEAKYTHFADCTSQ